MSRLRLAALIATCATPALVAVAVAWRLTGTTCTVHLDGSAWLLALSGFALAASGNPYRAFSASLAYLPLGYALSLSSCAATGREDAVPLVMLWPLLVVYQLVATFIGGALLRMMVHSFTATPQRPYRPSEPEP
jgi:hypothetical protein